MFTAIQLGNRASGFIGPAARAASTVSIFGSGLMGSGIAAVSANAGHKVHLVDVNEDLLKKSEARISKALQRLSKGKPEGSAFDALSKVSFTIDVKAAVADADLVVEAIVEDIRTKHKLFK